MHIEDFNMQTLSTTSHNLKCFWETLQFYDQKHSRLDKVEPIAFAVEFRDEEATPAEFLHLYPIRIRTEQEEFHQIFAQVCLNKVRLGFGHDIQKLFNEPNLPFKLYFKQYADGLETLLCYLSPESIR